MDLTPILTGLGIFGGAALLSALRILYEYERGVIFRLGKLTRAKGPGLIFVLPFGIERMRRMDLRIVALDIAPQDTITKDNVSLAVNAVVYFRVADPAKAVVEIEDYYFATSQLAQTTLRSVIGQSELDELLAERERINDVVRQIIDQGTDPWGIEVTGVEIKDIDLPKEMKRAMARQAEAERERRAKVISAEGEFQASARLAQAAKIIGRHPAALQLRFLQTVVEIAAENNSTTLFPIPLELFRGLSLKSESEEDETGTEITSEQLEALAVAASQVLPEGSDAKLLADSAALALGIGTGTSEGVRDVEPVRRADLEDD
ncbi:MAG TPA: slipin family protein [Longimicrobiales bacterium]|jgi:regulator of protease activity HflC (stomatin/prohibitin superfamily)